MSARKPAPFLLTGFGPWASAHFQTEEIRDRFLCDARTLPATDVEVDLVVDRGIKEALAFPCDASRFVQVDVARDP